VRKQEPEQEGQHDEGDRVLPIESRRPARVGPGGDLVRLDDQDRTLWDRALIAEGQELVRRCLRRDQPGPYQVQAAINAVHSDAATAADTDWPHGDRFARGQFRLPIVNVRCRGDGAGRPRSPRRRERQDELFGGW
jgi:predicted RNA polymerase sigma factor